MYYDSILDTKRKCNGIEKTVYIEDQDDIDQLLWMAKNEDRDAFVNHLSWICLDKGPYPNKTMFIFPKTLTPCDRSYIHTLGRKNKQYSSTIKGILHVFIR
jgi:hypothetical protein